MEKMQKIFIRNGNNESLIPYFKEHRARIVIAIGKYFKHAPIHIFLFQYNHNNYEHMLCVWRDSSSNYDDIHALLRS